MNEFWLSMESRFEEMTAREKVLVALCGLIAVIMLLFVFVLEPKMNQLSDSQKQLSRMKLENQRTEGDSLRAQAQLKRDPNAKVEQELKSLLAENQRLSEQLSEVIGQLITPSQMAEVLEKVLAAQKGVHLVSLQTLPSEPMVSDDEASQGSVYYIHPVRIELRGDYFSIYNYLNRMEKVTASYYWRSFSYKVDEYPKATLVLEVYTLGSREAFIGG